MIYLIGGAGNGNFGDELILRCWLEFLQERGIREPVTCDENYASISKRFLGERFPEVRFAESVNRLKARGPDTFFASFSRGWRFYENGGFERHPDLAELGATLAQTKVLHLHGGGYINTIWPKNAFLIGFAAATKREFGCRLVGTGLGLLPAAAAPDLYKPLLIEALETFDLLEVRDRWAYDYLRRISSAPTLLYGLDDSYLMRPTPPSPGPRTLHLSWFASADGLEPVLEELSGQGVAGFERILFWACINQDMKVFERIKAVCPRAEAIAWEPLAEGPIPVRPGDAMVTARFHPHLIAARHGAVGAYRTDRGYYDVKQGSVADLGSPFRRLGDGPLAAALGGGAAAEAAFNPIRRLDAERVAAKHKLASWIYEELLPRETVDPRPGAAVVEPAL